MEKMLGRIEVEKIPEELGGGWRAYIVGADNMSQSDGGSPEEARINLMRLVCDMLKIEKTKNLLTFLDEYEALCKKYGVYIGACGCCNSPWLIKGYEQEIEEHITHLIEQLSEEFEIADYVRRRVTNESCSDL